MVIGWSQSQTKHLDRVSLVYYHSIIHIRDLSLNKQVYLYSKNGRSYLHFYIKLSLSNHL